MKLVGKIFDRKIKKNTIAAYGGLLKTENVL